jgi:hypothetical protein
MLAEVLAAKSDACSREQNRDADRFAQACLSVLGSLTDELFAGRSNAANADALQTAIVTVEFALRRLGGLTFPWH